MNSREIIEELGKRLGCTEEEKNIALAEYDKLVEYLLENANYNESFVVIPIIYRLVIRHFDFSDFSIEECIDNYNYFTK